MDGLNGHDGHPCPNCGCTDFLPNSAFEKYTWWMGPLEWMVIIDCSGCLMILYLMALVSGRFRRHAFYVRCLKCGSLVKKKWQWVEELLGP